VRMLCAICRDQSGTYLAVAPEHTQLLAAANYVATMHQAGSQLPLDAFNAFAVFIQTGTISSRPTAWLQPLDTVTSCCTQGRVWSWSVSGHATCSSVLAKQLTVNLICCLSQGLPIRIFPCKVLVLVSIKCYADAIQCHC